MRGEIKYCDNGCRGIATETLTLSGETGDRVVRHYCKSCYIAALRVLKTYLGALR